MITDSALLKNCKWIILQWNINRMLPFHCCFVYQHVLIELQWYQIRWQEQSVATQESRVRALGTGIAPLPHPLTASTEQNSRVLILCLTIVWLLRLPGLNSPVLRLVRVRVTGDVWSAWRARFGTLFLLFRFHLKPQNSTKSQSEMRVIASLFCCQVSCPHESEAARCQSKS